MQDEGEAEDENLEVEAEYRYDIDQIFTNLRTKILRLMNRYKPLEPSPTGPSVNNLVKTSCAQHEPRP